MTVRVLFDNGGQLFYVTKHLMKQMNLKLSKVEKIDLILLELWDTKPSSARLLSCSYRNLTTQTVTISSMSSPIICTPLPSAIYSRKYPHLHDLHLADDGSEGIDILIRFNFY